MQPSTSGGKAALQQPSTSARNRPPSCTQPSTSARNGPPSCTPSRNASAGGPQRSGKYTKEKGTSSQKGIYYEQDATAFISLKALNNVEDFCLISNPSDCDPFDDVILCTKQGDRNVIYLFQVKRKENGEPITDKEFIGTKKGNKKQQKFKISNLCQKYQNKIKFIKNVIPPFYDAESCQFKIIIFTNRPMQDNSQIFEAVSHDSVFSTNDGSVYKFKEEFMKNHSKNYVQFDETQIKRQCLQESDQLMHNFLQSINIFTKQSNISNTSKADITNFFKTEDSIAIKIKEEYFRCIKNWWEIDHEKEYLTREIVCKILIHAALLQFSVSLDECNEGKYTKFLEILRINQEKNSNQSDHIYFNVDDINDGSNSSFDNNADDDEYEDYNVDDYRKAKEEDNNSSHDNSDVDNNSSDDDNTDDNNSSFDNSADDDEYEDYNVDDYRKAKEEDQKREQHIQCLDLLWKSIKNNNLSISSDHLQYILLKALEDFVFCNGYTDNDLYSLFKQIISPGDLNSRSITYIVRCLLGELPFIIKNCKLTLTEEYRQYVKIVFIESVEDKFKENLLDLDEDALGMLKKQVITTRSGQIFEVADIITDTSSISNILSLIIESRSNNINNMEEFFVDRRVMRVQLDETIFSAENQSTLENDVFIITGCSASEFIQYFKVNSDNIHHLEIGNEAFDYYLEQNLENNVIEPFLIKSGTDNKIQIRFNKKITYIIVANENVNIETTKLGNYHFIKIFRSRTNSQQLIVTLLKTNGNVENIKRFRLNKSCQIIEREMSGKYANSSKCKCCVQLKQFSNYLQQNPFVIISGIPGIGKTVLMLQICCTALTNDFILFVTLIDHYDYFENNEKSFRTPIGHLLYFCKNENAILKDFIQKKAQRNEILILFDGFDEIAPRYTKIVSKIINEFREQNYKIILTTRSVLKEKVEKIFGVLAITLTPFNIKEQEIFSQNYFNIHGSALLDYSKYKSIIMNSIKIDRECFRVPLNIQLISELIFNKIRLGYHLDEYYTFNQLEFYVYFIELKFEMVKKSNWNIDKSMIELYHKYFSIGMLFNKIPNYKIIETELTSELKVYTKQLENGLEKVGLLIGDINEVFIYRTVAEYFSAKWLYDVFVANDNLELLEGEKEFAHFIMKIVNLSNKNVKDDNFNFPVVRLFFDLMINQNKLHYAALKDNCQYIKEILNSEISMVKTLNNFNRNILFTIILSNNDSYEPRNKWLDILNLLLNNFKDILIEKDYSQTSILDYVEQRTLKEPPLKIIIKNIADRHVIYFNRWFDLWEIFRSENLYACDIHHLINVLKDPQTRYG